MRTNKELLQVFLNNQHFFETGLCLWVEILFLNDLITEEEEKYLYNLIDNNRPIFIKIKDTLKGYQKNCYYWKMGDINPRIKWLKKYLK